MTIDFAHILVFMAGAGAALMPQAYHKTFRAPDRRKKAQTLKRKARQWAGIKQHTRRREIYQALLDATYYLGNSGERLSRFASFRTANGMPVLSDSPAIGLLSLDGALHHAVYPLGGLPEVTSQMEIHAAKELLHFLHATIFCLMPYEYQDIYDFSNLATFAEIRAVLRRAITELKPTCPSAETDPLASDHSPIH